MPALKDITGQRFGRWRVIERMPRGYHSPKRVFWRCRCDCGNEHVVPYTSLAYGGSQSCGCLHRENIGNKFRTHGMSQTRTFAIWCAMLSRCSNPNVLHYKSYGGRGIKVCERWQKFGNFLADMGERPSSKHSLDRVDNDRGYEPGNVRWATSNQQAVNKRTNRSITAFGKTLYLIEWSRQTGISSKVIFNRLKRGWPPERALTR